MYYARKGVVKIAEYGDAKEDRRNKESKNELLKFNFLKKETKDVDLQGMLKKVTNKL